MLRELCIGLFRKELSLDHKVLHFTAKFLLAPLHAEESTEIKRGVLARRTRNLGHRPGHGANKQLPASYTLCINVDADAGYGRRWPHFRLVDDRCAEMPAGGFNEVVSADDAGIDLEFLVPADLTIDDQTLLRIFPRHFVVRRVGVEFPDGIFDLYGRRRLRRKVLKCLPEIDGCSSLFPTVTPLVIVICLR
ncbi:hypothetical protein [Cupriavidus necator]|uniref:hypothetical protein n=1 Tax=Cupriavidus necator TaxID=106590 RepID=UPI000F4EF1E8